MKNHSPAPSEADTICDTLPVIERRIGDYTVRGTERDVQRVESVQQIVHLLTAQFQEKAALPAMTWEAVEDVAATAKRAAQKLEVRNATGHEMTTLPLTRRFTGTSAYGLKTTVEMPVHHLQSKSHGLSR